MFSVNGSLHCYCLQMKFVKVMFLQVSVCPREGCAWQGGIHGGGHACQGGHAWWGCVTGIGGVHGRGGCMADTTRYSDTVNERTVCILLECILVLLCGVRMSETKGFHRHGRIPGKGFPTTGVTVCNTPLQLTPPLTMYGHDLSKIP